MLWLLSWHSLILSTASVCSLHHHTNHQQAMKAAANEYTACICSCCSEPLSQEYTGTDVLLLLCGFLSDRVNRAVSTGLHHMRCDLGAFQKCVSQFCYCALGTHSDPSLSHTAGEASTVSPLRKRERERGIRAGWNKAAHVQCKHLCFTCHSPWELSHYFYLCSQHSAWNLIPSFLLLYTRTILSNKLDILPRMRRGAFVKHGTQLCSGAAL